MFPLEREENLIITQLYADEADNSPVLFSYDNDPRKLQPVEFAVMMGVASTALK